MSRFNIVIAVLFLLALQSLAATRLSLTTNPRVVKDGLTDTLTLRCSLLDSSRGISRVSSTSFNVEQVNSIIVFRDEGQQPGCSGVKSQLHLCLAKRKTPIARVIGSNPAEAITDKENLQVEGVTSPKISTHPKYLELVWTKPSKKQDGQYTCEAHVLDWLGRGIVLEAKAVVKVEEPGIPELISEIGNLKNRIDSQEKTIVDMKTVLKAPHAEQGEVQCSSGEWRDNGNNHREINKYVYFNERYTDIPVIGTGIVRADISDDYNARYYILVRNVTTRGFKITCGTWHNSVIFELRVRWTSTVA